MFTCIYFLHFSCRSTAWNSNQTDDSYGMLEFFFGFLCYLVLGIRTGFKGARLDRCFFKGVNVQQCKMHGFNIFR